MSDVSVLGAVSVFSQQHPHMSITRHRSLILLHNLLA